MVPLGSDGVRQAMSGDGWDVGEAFGTGLADEVDFDEIQIDEPLPDEVVDAGYAPDPEFFSDDEITDNLGDSGIPEVALDAYLDGADLTNSEFTECGLPWSVLAAIGRGRVQPRPLRRGDAAGRRLRHQAHPGPPPRRAAGPRPGPRHDGGDLDGDDIYDRAVGPMQIIPSTWDDIGVDANEDDRSDPNNIFDAAWGAGIYLCNGDVDLTKPGQLARAVRRYNHTDEYVRVVLELASAYDSGELEPSPGVDPASLGETPMDPVVFEDFEYVDPAPYLDDDFDPSPPAPPPARAPAPPPPAPPPPEPQPAPTTIPPAPAPTTPPTTAPPAPPTTLPGGPGTTVPPAPTTTVPPATTTTVPGGSGTTVPGGPGTTVPGGPDTTSTPPTSDPAAPPTTSPAGDTSSSIPPASVGWSPTMLDFVTTTVAERAAECSAPEPSPAPTQPSVPAPNAAVPPCPPPEAD